MCGSDVWSETKRSKGAALAEGKPIGLVSVAVVAYNEASCIGTLFEDIEAQDFPHDRMEIVLVDSASTDDTKAVMRAFAARHEEVEGARQGEGGNAASSQPFARVVLCDNPARILPAGWNVAIGEFHGDVLMRIDAHARIPADFVANNVRVLEEGEFVCGGPRPTAAHPSTPWSETLLLAEDSAFGSSIADYRKGGGKRYVSSAFHAAFRREVLERVGPYDERLVRTEDNDYFYRVREAGYRIRFDESIRSTQYARSTLRRMVHQKYANGYWIGRTLHVSPRCVSYFHLVPAVFVLALLLGALVGAICSWIPLVVLVALYLAADLAVSAIAVIGSRKRSAHMALLPAIFPLIHVPYGVGTLLGVCKVPTR